jgi:hypothetical protein
VAAVIISQTLCIIFITSFHGQGANMVHFVIYARKYYTIKLSFNTILSLIILTTAEHIILNCNPVPAVCNTTKTLYVFNMCISIYFLLPC